MLKAKWMGTLLLTFCCVCLFTVPVTAQEMETAITCSPDDGQRAAIYYEPSESAKLKGEYFNGVSVSVLEHISNEWVKVDIHTGGSGGNGYMLVKDLAFGETGKQVIKNTIQFEAMDDNFILATHPYGQSGDLGPFEKGMTVELLGVMIRYDEQKTTQTFERPLVFEQSILHVKIGDDTGFYCEFDQLKRIEAPK